MKKIIGILGAVLIAVTLFGNMNLENSDVLAMETASATCGPAPACHTVCGPSTLFNCYLTCEGTTITCYNSFPHNPDPNGGGFQTPEGN